MKTIEINLANMTEQQLHQLLIDNEAGIAELCSLLEGLFEMWAAALKFGTTVTEYGEANFENFLEIFIQHAAPQHGIPPEALINLLRRKKAKQTRRVH